MEVKGADHHLARRVVQESVEEGDDGGNASDGGDGGDP